MLLENIHSLFLIVVVFVVLLLAGHLVALGFRRDLYGLLSCIFGTGTALAAMAIFAVMVAVSIVLAAVFGGFKLEVAYKSGVIPTRFRCIFDSITCNFK